MRGDKLQRVTRKLWGGDGNVHYLERGDDIRDIVMSKFPKVYTFNMCSLLYPSCTSVKLMNFCSGYADKFRHNLADNTY